MKKYSLFLTSALSALLFAGAAYADNGCPEGTTALIDPQANTRYDFEAVPTRSVHQPDVEAADSTAPAQDNPLPIREEDRIEQITNASRDSGWVLSVGLSNEYYIGIGIGIQTGYHFGGKGSEHSGQYHVSFGLYLDASTFYIPDLSDDPDEKDWGKVAAFLHLMPTLHVFAGRFRFSLGVGAGAMVLGSFSLTSVAGADWFFSEHSYFGGSIGVRIPIYKDEFDDITADGLLHVGLHYGYKF